MGEEDLFKLLVTDPLIKKQMAILVHEVFRPPPVKAAMTPKQQRKHKKSGKIWAKKYKKLVAQHRDLVAREKGKRSK